MLTRLKVKGFKNLIDVDVHFGPFTCIAGPNGVGKSNLFDAIHFLSLLADKPLAEAVLEVRGARESKSWEWLPHRTGRDYLGDVTFEAEMLIPREGSDELGVRARAAATCVRYNVQLRFDGDYTDEGEEILFPPYLSSENLVAIEPVALPAKWRKATGSARERGRSFIETVTNPKLHVFDPERKMTVLREPTTGRGVLRVRLSDAERTLLSTVSASQEPTASLVRSEMRSWRLLHLEPSAMRRPDPLNERPYLGADGSRLAATIQRLTLAKPKQAAHEARVLATLSNLLAELVDGVRGVEIDRDNSRGLLTINVRMRDGTSYPAAALSDGTLRFLALAVMSIDPKGPGLLCLEEPENGIPPAKIPRLVRLLENIAVSKDYAIDDDNPLRQVIVNTHSPSVVAEVDENDLLMAGTTETDEKGKWTSGLRLRCLPGTWRDTEGKMPAEAPGRLLEYLLPHTPPAKGGHRVVDRPEMRRYLEAGD